MRNVGKLDAVVRLVLAAALLSLCMVLDGKWAWFGLIGLVPLVTAIYRFCPLYQALGVQTSPHRSDYAHRIPTGK